MEKFSLSRARQVRSGWKLSGPLPDFGALPLLKEIVLDGNDFSGSIPDSFADSSSWLKRISIEDNRLTGAIPASLGSKNIQTLRLAGNQIDHVPPEICRLGNETTSCDRWHRNDFWNSDAHICEWYGIVCEQGHVTMITLEDNNLQGTLPSVVVELASLQILRLGSNFIDVSFQNVDRARNLVDLRLPSTRLTSVQFLDRAFALTYLDVSSNILGGNFPAQVLELPNLRVLLLADTGLSGSLPDVLPPRLRVLDARHNQLTGTVPHWADARTLTVLQLSFNRLRGSLPEDLLERAAALSVVHMAFNDEIEGMLPAALSHVPDLDLQGTAVRMDACRDDSCSSSASSRSGVSLLLLGSLFFVL